MSLDDDLTAAEQEERDFITISVCINPRIARERGALLEALKRAKDADHDEAQADARLGAPTPEVDAHEREALAELAEFDLKVPSALKTIRFTQMDPNAWTLLTAAHPIREDVAIDMRYGYDFNTVSVAAARATGQLVTDDGLEEISDEQWDRLYGLMSPHDAGQIVDAIFTLNEYLPEKAIEALTFDFGAA